MKVIEMNVSLMNTSKYFFNYSVVYYFGYAYLAIEKFIKKLTSE